jgi:hypothetical protein
VIEANNRPAAYLTNPCASPSLLPATPLVVAFDLAHTQPDNTYTPPSHPVPCFGCVETFLLSRSLHPPHFPVHRSPFFFLAPITSSRWPSQGLLQKQTPSMLGIPCSLPRAHLIESIVHLDRVPARHPLPPSSHCSPQPTRPH